MSNGLLLQFIIVRLLLSSLSPFACLKLIVNIAGGGFLHYTLLLQEAHAHFARASVNLPFPPFKSPPPTARGDGERLILLLSMTVEAAEGTSGKTFAKKFWNPPAPS